MLADDNKAIVRQTFEKLSTVVEGHADLYGDDWTGHFPGMPTLDADGHRMYAVVMETAFPDLERQIEDLVAEGDRVVARWTAKGTHLGDFNGMPPTGKFATSSGITIFRIADGRIVEEWSENDLLGLLTQLGALPGPANG